MAGKAAAAATRKSNSAKPKKAGGKTPSTRGEKRAGIVWGVGRTFSALRKGRFSDRFGVGAAVFMAGVLQYLTMEITEMAGDIAAEKKTSLIQPRHIMQAIRNDEELMLLFANVQLSEGGNKQHIDPFLFHAKGKKGGIEGT